MRSSTETYKEVAERCSAFEKKCDCKGEKNSAGEEISCLSCRHFAKDEHCKLDLYDSIEKRL